jgi:hypothetical protein
MPESTDLYSPSWFRLTAFIGFDVLQSALTNSRPAMSIFRAMNLKEGGYRTEKLELSRS